MQSNIIQQNEWKFPSSEEKASVCVSTQIFSGHREKIMTLNIICFIVKSTSLTQHIRISSLLKEGEHKSLSAYTPAFLCKLAANLLPYLSKPCLETALDSRTMHFLSGPQKGNQGCSQVYESERLTKVNWSPEAEASRGPGQQSALFSQRQQNPVRLCASTS